MLVYLWTIRLHLITQVHIHVLVRIHYVHAILLGEKTHSEILQYVTSGLFCSMNNSYVSIIISYLDAPH